MDRRLWRPRDGARLRLRRRVRPRAGAAPGAGRAERARAATIAPGDADRGEAVFATTCAGCHGEAGAGGGVGPKLAGAGLSAALDPGRGSSSGAGVMPAGLVQGTREADVLAYVVSIGAAK